MAMLEIISPSKVRVSREGVRAFNARWPCSELRHRSYWFEFDYDWDLIDTDVPEQDDGSAALALSLDCQMFLEEGILPDWASQFRCDTCCDDPRACICIIED